MAVVPGRRPQGPAHAGRSPPLLTAPRSLSSRGTRVPPGGRFRIELPDERTGNRTSGLRQRGGGRLPFPGALGGVPRRLAARGGAVVYGVRRAAGRRRVSGVRVRAAVRAAARRRRAGRG